jgi:hypothetical protein
MNFCAAANEAGVPAIMCDVTNVLRTGDVVFCEDADLPSIIECKASKRAPDPRFVRQGRTESGAAYQPVNATAFPRPIRSLDQSGI